MLIGTNWSIVATDTMNVTLSWKVTRRKGKLAGQEVWVTQGYYGTPAEALHALVNQGVRDSKLTDLKTIVAKIDELHRMIEALPPTYHQNPLNKGV